MRVITTGGFMRCLDFRRGSGQSFAMGAGDYGDSQIAESTPAKFLIRGELH